MKQKPINGYPWITKVEYYNVETGEQLTKKEVEKHYIKLKKTKTTYHDRSVNITEYTYECGKGKQLRLL